jgi:hypothetical protein
MKSITTSIYLLHSAFFVHFLCQNDGWNGDALKSRNQSATTAWQQNPGGWFEIARDCAAAAASRNRKFVFSEIAGLIVQRTWCRCSETLITNGKPRVKRPKTSATFRQ